MEKNTSSASPAETPWRSFLRAFPTSQSNSVIFDKSIKVVYYRNIQATANGPRTEGPICCSRFKRSYQSLRF